jgi:uncharacterized damage-inducible protein DinB
MTERVDTRQHPPLQASEAETVLAFLDYHRATLRMKVSGLDPSALDRTLGPSTMTLGGLLSHLTYVEDSWFSVVLAGNTPAEPWAAVDWSADEDWDWHVAAGRSLEDLLPAYDDAVARADEHIARALELDGLDTPSVRSSRRVATPYSLRWIVLHMIEEYARHNGHADLLREAIDGQVGE